ncbi:hypothetical protein ACXR0O_16955 [Verrucomicrobiota bacterium sgz303538]
MRQLVSRYTEPLLARIPDFSAEPPRKQAAVGLIASIVFHLLAFLFFAILVWLTPSKPGYEQVKEDAPLEIEVVPFKPQTEEERLAAEEKRREMLFSQGLEKSKDKPDNPDFESDQDMVAGSELPANGLLPLPSQEGRTDLPTRDFATQDVILGATDNAAEALQRGPKGNEPPRPLYKPQPLTQAQIAAANEASATTALPKVSATPPPRFEERLKPATPPPLRKVPLPQEGELVISSPKPATPAPAPKAEPEKRPELVDAPLTRPAMATPAPQLAALATPAPAPGGSATPKFREQLEKVRIEGNISRNGKSGVNAVGTPMAMYLRRMGQLIDSRWQIYLKRRSEWVMTGAVRVRFAITPDGRTTDVAVEANESNQAVADICVQAVRDSKLEALPPDAQPFMRDGRFEYAINFTLF